MTLKLYWQHHLHFDFNCQVTLQNSIEIMKRRVNSCIQAGCSIQLLSVNSQLDIFC
jgi:hypothetical protein